MLSERRPTRLSVSRIVLSSAVDRFIAFLSRPCAKRGTPTARCAVLIRPQAGSASGGLRVVICRVLFVGRTPTAHRGGNAVGSLADAVVELIVEIGHPAA